MDHMTSIGFSISLANAFLFGEEEGDSRYPHAIIIENKIENIETLISTTDKHKNKGRVVNETNTHYPNVSQRSDPQKKKLESVEQEKRKSSANNFDDGGDQNPLKGKLERSHKL
jgi:hypothetical protein